MYDTDIYRLPVGSIFFTPEQQRAYREKKEKALKDERNKHAKRDLNSGLGKFCFIPTNERFKDLSPETATRLIFLSTFLNYSDNRLMKTERTPMKRKDLASILGLSKATISRFWKEISPAYITEDDDGMLFANKRCFRRGSIPKKQFIQLQKIYIDGVRRLYKSTDIKKHKRLGYIFKLLPYVNLEYNLLCQPEYIGETDLKKIELISMREFCMLIDFDINHLNELVAAYREIRFDVGGKKERFCALTYDGLDKQNAKIFINPHILYAGSDYSKVEVLGVFCQ